MTYILEWRLFPQQSIAAAASWRLGGSERSGKREIVGNDTHVISAYTPRPPFVGRSKRIGLQNGQNMDSPIQHAGIDAGRKFIEMVATMDRCKFYRLIPSHRLLNAFKLFGTGRHDNSIPVDCSENW
jgi:hypothetical protein